LKRLIKQKSHLQKNATSLDKVDRINAKIYSLIENSIKGKIKSKDDLGNVNTRQWWNLINMYTGKNKRNSCTFIQESDLNLINTHFPNIFFFFFSTCGNTDKEQGDK
jgi:hypothetical protein